jgi:hypothetical protein
MSTKGKIAVLWGSLALVAALLLSMLSTPIAAFSAKVDLPPGGQPTPAGDLGWKQELPLLVGPILVGIALLLFGAWMHWRIIRAARARSAPKVSD